MNVKKKIQKHFCVCVYDFSYHTCKSNLSFKPLIAVMYSQVRHEKENGAFKEKNRLTMLHSLKAAICCHQHLTLNCDVSETMTHPMKLF